MDTQKTQMELIVEAEAFRSGYEKLNGYDPTTVDSGHFHRVLSRRKQVDEILTGLRRLHGDLSHVNFPAVKETPFFAYIAEVRAIYEVSLDQLDDLLHRLGRDLAAREYIAREAERVGYRPSEDWREKERREQARKDTFARVRERRPQIAIALAGDQAVEGES